MTGAERISLLIRDFQRCSPGRRIQRDDVAVARAGDDQALPCAGPTRK